MPDHPQLEMMRAIREFVAGDLDASKAILARVRKRFGMDSARGFEAQVDLASRDYDGALDNLGHLGAWDHQDTLTYYATKALIYDLMGDDVHARAYYDSTQTYAEERLANGQESHILYSEIAQARAYFGDRKGARAAIDKAVELMPMSKDALTGTDVILTRSIVNMRLGDEDAAIDDIEYLLEVPSNVSREWLRQHPGFDSLRDNPRFQELMRGGPNS
jgi:tetratricopeptide (TPR) repeat protein